MYVLFFFSEVLFYKISTLSGLDIKALLYHLNPINLKLSLPQEPKDQRQPLKRQIRATAAPQ